MVAGMAETSDLASDTGEAKADFQATEKPREFRYKNGIPGKQSLRWEKVNDATIELTAGDLINVPVSHGQWAGYRTTSGRAWVIQIAHQWLARCRDQASGPTSLNKAKADAMAMAKGAFGDFQIRKLIEHLNGLTARLLDRENKEPPGCNRTALKPKVICA
jgi:hypothetical protein